MRNPFWTEITATACVTRLGLALGDGDRAWIREVDVDDDDGVAAVYIERPADSDRCDVFVNLDTPSPTPAAFARWADDGGRAP